MKNKIRWIHMLVIVVVAAVCLTGCDNETKKNGSSFKIGLVTDTGGLNDESFNQTAWEGCKDCREKLGVSIKGLESKRDEEYVPNLTRLARDSTNLIWAAGFKFSNVLPQVAESFPNVKFAAVDTNLNGRIPKNVVAVTFKEEEAAFLIGVVSGLTTKTNKVGFIGGIHSELIEKFRVGFMEGVRAANATCEIKSAYADSFTDATKGRSLSSAMYNSEVDIIFHAAGGVGKGLFDEVKTRKPGKFWAIGVDKDQSGLAPQHTLTSLIKRVDVAVLDITTKLTKGEFQGGTEVKLGLKENAVTLVEDKISTQVKKKVEEFKNKIISKEIQVSKTQLEMNRKSAAMK